MAFNGSLFTMGGDEFPSEYIFKESYTAQREIQDLDSNRNTTGLLERNVLSHESFVITFTVKPMWSDEGHDDLWRFINSHWSKAEHRKCRIVAFCPETLSYVDGDFYMPTPIITMNLVDKQKKRILYNSYEIQFIKY